MLTALAAALLIQAAPATPDLIEALARSRLTSAYVVGMCETYIRPETSRYLIDTLAPPDAPDHAAMLEAHRRGRLDPRRPDLPPLLCSDLLGEAADRLGHALARVRAIEGAEP